MAKPETEKASAADSLDLQAALRLLREYHGSPGKLPTTDAFEFILLENVAYLATSSRRLEAFERLRRTVGTAPEAIMAADGTALERVTAEGILQSTFASKLRECAQIALEKYGGELESVLDGPLVQAKRALRSFPGIGEPGAEKILTFTGRAALLAPESNGLRVLVRLGLVAEEKSYARMYGAARRLATELPADPAVMTEAHLLLQHHGQTLCKRSEPKCGECPLAAGCGHARAAARSA
jgi:endonuclease-3